MTIQKINISFSQYTDANLLNKGEGIYGSMLSNPFFTTPIPAMADVQTALTNYSNALSAAINRSRDNIAVKNQCRAILESMLTQLGMYVMNTANGDVTQLISSGYDLRKSPAPVYITTPGYVTLTNGLSSGDMVSSSPRVQGALGYLHQVAPDPVVNESDWQTYPSSMSNFTFTGLVPGKKYAARIVAIGSSNQVAYGPVSSQFAQ